MSAAEAAARALGHPVSVALPAEDRRPIVAASVGGDPPTTRVAWVDPASGAPIARVACPPGRPSRFRPVVATAVTLDEAQAGDRVLAARVAPGLAGVRAVVAVEEAPDDVAAGPDGLALLRVPQDAMVIAVDALDPGGEPLGRLSGAGVAELRVTGGQVSGRLGLGHGMAAGIGPGHWARDLEEAEFAAGYGLLVPEWLPPGLAATGPPRVEPDAAYPAAPPALVLVWSGEGDERLLLRQAPAPLASPDPGGPRVREVPIGAATGILRGRWLVTLVWETETRAFGLQARRLPGAEAAALRVARSIPA